METRELLGRYSVCDAAVAECGSFSSCEGYRGLEFDPGKHTWTVRAPRSWKDCGHNDGVRRRSQAGV